MTQPTGSNDNGGGSTATPPDKTFTQADVDRIVADRLTRERAKFSDYDELKQKAAQADSTKSDMDKVIEKLAAMEDKAGKAERRAMLAEVAGQTGLSMAKVERLQGESTDELLADAEKVFDVKPGSGTGGPAGGGQGNAGTGGQGQGDKSGQAATGAGAGPPKVTGEPSAGQNDPDMDFGKIADEVLS